ncbi:MAG: stage IV sporulation protein A [Lachnospiraceae bacterium]
MQEQFSVYNDIKMRTDGEVYIGVVGPVRTGKSTFIKRFMDLIVLPNMREEKDRELARDELPQSAAGKTIMTTEPKFIPKDAVTISVGDGITMKVRMIDCVGYMVNGAAGHMENEQERMVKTPWFDYEIPFTKAAEIGTRKVITDHSTIGILVTADGSFTDIDRAAYEEVEQQTVAELKNLHKPFVVILNSSFPYSTQTKELAQHLEEQYQVSVLPMNCEQMKIEDVRDIFSHILLEFPIHTLEFVIPKWVETLPDGHWLKQSMIETVRQNLFSIHSLREVSNQNLIGNEYVRAMQISKVHMDSGIVTVDVQFAEEYYYQVLSQMTGIAIENDYQLIGILRELGNSRMEYEKVEDALKQVEARGYGVVTPSISQITVEEPVIIKHGNKYGVRMKAQAPSIHLIKADVQTEIAPIVGTEEQARDLIRYIKEESGEDQDKIWQVNIFGKTMEQLVEEGIEAKTSKMTEESQMKLQDTMEKIINDGNGGLVCIII